MSTKTFNTKIAEKLGVGPAILLAELDMMQGDSLQDDKGRNWTRQCMRIILTVFPFYSQPTLRKYMYLLENEKFISTKRISPGIYYSINQKKLEKFKNS